MIRFSESKNIYLYSENVDMRMGMKTIKMYYEDDYGSWLLQNRLHDGRFKWPKGLEIGAKINRIQLEGLCKGLEVIESKKKKEDKEVEYY